jgi:O-antigen ligase
MMELAPRIGARNLPWVGAVAALCAAIGVLAGVKPQLGLELAVGLAFAAAVLVNLTLGLALFTIISFLEVINGSSLSVTKVAGLLLFVSWFIRTATNRTQERSLFEEQPLLVAAGVAFVSWSAISIAWAQSSSAAVSGTERYLLNILLLPIVFGTIRTRRQFLWIGGAFLVGAAASAAFGLLQSAGPVGRLTGTIGDANEQAAVLVAGMMLAIGLSSILPVGSRGRFFAIALGLVCAFGFVNTVSRGGFVALGCTLVAGVFFGGRWRGRALLLGVLAVVSVGLYFSVLATLAERQHLSSTSSTGRTDLWRIGWNMFGDQPLGGVGTGNFPVAAVRYVQTSGPLTRADLIVDVPHATHNQYLDIIDELGIVGIAAFLTLIATAVAAAARAAHLYERRGDRQMELVSRMLVLALLGMLAADVFLSGQYSKQLWMLLALPAPLLALARSEQR